MTSDEQEGRDRIAKFVFPFSFTEIPSCTTGCTTRNLRDEYWIPAIGEITTAFVKFNTSNSGSDTVCFIAIGY